MDTRHNPKQSREQALTQPSAMAASSSSSISNGRSSRNRRRHRRRGGQAVEKQSLEQQHADRLQQQIEATARRGSVLPTTAYVITHMHRDGYFQWSDQRQVDWSLVDVNLVLSDGRRFHTALPAGLRAAVTGTLARHFNSSLQSVIRNKLLEYAPTAASLQPSQPRDADELLQWLAIQLADCCGNWLLSFIQLLVTTLHERNFDLNRCSYDGHTLLTAYASASQNQPTIEVECLLMHMGADAFKADNFGRSPIFIWIAVGNFQLVESLLIDKGAFGFPQLNQRVNLWQPDSDGRTLLECMQQAPKKKSFAPCVTVLMEMQHHWKLHERPLVQSLLTLHTPLIPNLARLALDYIDGGAADK